MGYRMTVMPKKQEIKIRKKKKEFGASYCRLHPVLCCHFWVADTFYTGVDVTSL